MFRGRGGAKEGWAELESTLAKLPKLFLTTLFTQVQIVIIDLKSHVLFVFYNRLSWSLNVLLIVNAYVREMPLTGQLKASESVQFSHSSYLLFLPARWPPPTWLFYQSSDRTSQVILPVRSSCLAGEPAWQVILPTWWFHQSSDLARWFCQPGDSTCQVILLPFAM